MLPTQLREACANRVWPLALLLTAVAAAALFTSAPERLISDGQLELYSSPGRVLARQAAAWDPSRGLGAVRTEFWPVPAAVLGVLRLVGASAVVAERLWHLGLLVAGGIGVITVLRLRRPRIGLEHAAAALFYTFNPFTAVLLTPWPLFIGYALAPWFVVAFVRGVTSDRPWRWAAMLALLVFIPGAVNFAAVWYAGLPLAAAAVYLVHVERVSDWRRVGGWMVRALLLSLAVSLAAMVASRTGDSGIVEHVEATPPSETVNRFSSWAESWRGLGYWRTEAQPDGYADSWPLVVASFAAPCAAVAALWLVRERLRLLFGIVMVLGVTVMVGIHPVGDPPPFGRLLQDGFDAFPVVARLRATYLAGPTVLLGVAGLVGLALATATGAIRDRPRPRLAPVPAVVAVVAIAAGSFPFWTGEVYATVDRREEVPPQWRRALAWLDRQPEEGRVLVLADGGDIVDAFLRRPHLQAGDGARFQGTPLAADLLSALDDHLASGSVEAGTLAPVATRLGIRFVLLDGDADDGASASLREDPELRPARRFGSLEIYELEGVEGVVRAEPPAAPLLVSGDGSTWPVLAAGGRLDGDRALRYTSEASPGELADALERGGPLVITDTDTDVGPRPGAAAVVEHGGGATITELGVTDPDQERAGRPAAAFDGDPDTAWLAGAAPEAAVLRVDLGRPVEIGELTVVRTTGAPRVASATLRFSDGGDAVVDLTRPSTTVRLRPRRVMWFEVRIDEVAGQGTGQAGIAEVVVGDLDLRETVQLPDDVVRAAAARPELRSLLRNADLTYLMSARSPAGEELQRRFRTPTRRAYDVAGTLRLTPRTSDAVVWTAASGGCHGGIVRVDGADIAVRVDAGGGDVTAGDPATFSSCEPLSIGGGWHELVTTDGVLVEGVSLRSPAAVPSRPQTPSNATVQVLEQSPTRLLLRVRGPAGTLFTIGQSFHEGWRAEIDGRSLGRPLPLDTLTWWRTPSAGVHEVEVTFDPQRRHDLALLITAAAVAGCAWLAGHRRRT